MIGAKRVKKGSFSLCGLDKLVHKAPKRLANQDLDERRSIGLASIFVEYMKPRISLSNKKKKKKKKMEAQQLVEKHEEMLKSTRKVSLKEWILSSPSLNVSSSSTSKHFSGRIHPLSTDSNLRPTDVFCSENNVNLNSDNVDELEEEEEEDVTEIEKRKKKVSFRLPALVDIFILDSEDGYYFYK